MSLPATERARSVVLIASAVLMARVASMGAQVPTPPPAGAPLQGLPVRLEWERFMSALRSGDAALPPGVTVVDSASSPRVRAMAAMLQQRVARLNDANEAARPRVECPMPVSRVDSARVPGMPVGPGDSARVETRRVTPPCVNPLDRLPR